MDKIKETNLEAQVPKKTPDKKPQKEDKKLKEMAKGVTEGVKDLGVEGKEGSESSFEARISEASEMLQEDQGSGVSPVQQATSQAAQMVQVKAALGTLPSRAKMRLQVKKQLTKEINKLNKKINKTVNPYELNNLMSRVRELRHFLARLAVATYEVLKNIYLKVIHGIA